jgi:leader peptidase (prepilin peptidase)/N-methyltransferase
MLMDTIALVYGFILFFVFAIGATFGSFLNVLIYRLPLKLDFVKGSSFCPKCEHKLGALDLVPIFSYLLLSGKCRYCKVPISPRYMIVEIIGGVAALFSYLAFLPPGGFLAGDGASFSTRGTLAAVLFFAVLATLIVVAFIDADTQEIPNSLNVALLVCGVLAVFVGPEVALLDRGIGLVVVSVPMFVLAFAVAGAFGGGDIKLMAAAGVLLGWQGVLVAVFIGIVIGGVYGITLLLLKKKTRKDHFAFGPALCIGIAVALFYGAPIVQWYGGFF